VEQVAAGGVADGGLVGDGRPEVDGLAAEVQVPPAERVAAEVDGVVGAGEQRGVDGDGGEVAVGGVRERAAPDGAGAAEVAAAVDGAAGVARAAGEVHGGGRVAQVHCGCRRVGNVKGSSGGIK